MIPSSSTINRQPSTVNHQPSCLRVPPGFAKRILTDQTEAHMNDLSSVCAIDNVTCSSRAIAKEFVAEVPAHAQTRIAQNTCFDNEAAGQLQQEQLQQGQLQQLQQLDAQEAVEAAEWMEIEAEEGCRRFLEGNGGCKDKAGSATTAAPTAATPAASRTDAPGTAPSGTTTATSTWRC
jgi:hypothetical protein